MKTKVALLVALLALAPAALAACGGDDDEDTTDEPTTTAPTDENGAGGGGGDAGDVVQVTADPGGDLAYVEDSLTAQANGGVTFELTNEASIPHDIRIEEDGEDIGGTETVTGGSTEATVDLTPGEYTFYCSVPGHREGGMEGTLTVN